jgi:hypothetical protein
MKRSELKSKIEEIITELLDENTAFELTGATGAKTLQSFSNDSEAQKFKAQNPNVRSIKKI